MSGVRLKCGCVTGFYWCQAHDIYVRHDAADPRWTGGECCSCHILAPCSFCTRETPTTTTTTDKGEA